MPDWLTVTGDAVRTGEHGEHDFVYAAGEPVPDTGISNVVFEAGTGWGAVGWEVFDGLEFGGVSIGADPRVRIEHTGESTSTSPHDFASATRDEELEFSTFAVTFHGVATDDNSPENNKAVGVATDQVNRPFNQGDEISLLHSESDQAGDRPPGEYSFLRTHVNGEENAVELANSPLDWSSPRDIRIEWDGTEARLYVDNGLEASTTDATGSSEYRSAVQLEDDGNVQPADFLEIDRVSENSI